jgi:uncharacterized YigZ family protein
MLFTENYFIPEQDSQIELKVRGSRFIAYSFKVFTVEEMKQSLETIKQLWPDATHHCYACVLNPDKSFQGFNDDGEPANTAGRPILRKIISHDLTNVLVIVVRYFGGKMLGVPGLIEAYGEGADLVLKAAGKVERVVEILYEITFDFEQESDAFRLVKLTESRMIGKEYDKVGKFKVAVPVSKSENFESQAKAFYKLQVKNII